MADHHVVGVVLLGHGVEALHQLACGEDVAAVVVLGRMARVLAPVCFSQHPQLVLGRELATPWLGWNLRIRRNLVILRAPS